jgi:predicted nucleic acid-binding protein
VNANILVDTSAWVEFDRATGSAVDTRLTTLIVNDHPLAVTEPVVMEVLAGARNPKRERDLRRLLSRFELIRFDPIADFEGAVHIYRSCRGRGVTPRGLIDYLIASVASRTGAHLLASDRDLAAIATVMHLQLDEASLRT